MGFNIWMERCIKRTKKEANKSAAKWKRKGHLVKINPIYVSKGNYIYQVLSSKPNVTPKKYAVIKRRKTK